jgi:acetyl esterase/lipase
MHIVRFILLLLLFTASLVNFFPVPSKETWYVGIAVPEFPWIFMLASLAMFLWSCYSKKLRVVCMVLSAVTFIIFTSPIARAYNVGSNFDEKLSSTFGVKTSDLKAFHQPKPFSFVQMFTGNGTRKIPFTTYHYAMHTGVDLTLNFTPSAVPGVRPCLIVVHGGSWKRGDNQVATINYRLAPKFHSPAPQEDLHAAFAWLRTHATELKIDTNNFVLTGRSAGAQIVLTMAYTGNEHGVKGVAAFYGPTDMLWSYKYPDNPLIMDSRAVERDFLGGSPTEVYQKYVAESAMFHVNPQTVPTMLLHGMNDAHVWYQQSERLEKILNDNKVKNMVVLFPWATHGCEYNLNGPAGQLSIYAVERFFYALTQM